MTLFDILSAQKTYPFGVKFNILTFSHQFMAKLYLGAILSKNNHLDGIIQAIKSSTFADFASHRKGTHFSLCECLEFF